MKILRLTTLLDFGGQEKQYLSFTEKPKLLQHQYIFAAIGFGGNAERTLRERGFEVHVLNRNFSIRNLANIWAVYKLIKKVKPDVVHTAAAEANFFGIVAAKLAGVKTIIGEEIGIPNHSFTAQKVFRLVYRLADKVICVSRSVRTQLIKMKEISENKGIVLYNPVSVPKKFPRNPSDQFRMVYVGRLEKVKNIGTLLRSFAKLKQPNLELILVGDGRERAELKRLAAELNLGPKVIFTGFAEEPSRYLCNADLFILPSYSEGFGIAVVEAMFLELPVLCSYVGGIPEFIEDEKNGWLFDPRDELELTNKMSRIVSLNKDKLITIGVSGKTSTFDKFSVRTYIRAIENIYTIT